MIENISKITLYVNNQEQAKQFWTEKIGFQVICEQQMGPVTWLEVAPRPGSPTVFVLYDKQLMLTQKNGASAEHPSVILSTKDISKAHKHMKENGVNAGELMELPYGRMFSFKDPDGNEYLLREDH